MLAQRQQLTCQCAKCTAKHGIPPYVDLPAPTPSAPSPSSAIPVYQPATRPTYCPNCAKPRTYRTYDYADVLIQDYMGMTRQLAIDIIRQFNEWRESSFRNPVRNSQLDVIDYLTDRGHSKMLMRAYVTPLDWWPVHHATWPGYYQAATTSTLCVVCFHTYLY
jgi:hypothetical protein